MPALPVAPPAARLRVNPILCEAFGFCAEYAPELFALDEWGYAWPHSREAPAALEELAYEAARLCPTRAIIIEALHPAPAVQHGAKRAE